MDRGGVQPRSHLALLPFRVRRGGALRRRGGAPLRRCNGSRNAVAAGIGRAGMLIQPLPLAGLGIEGELANAEELLRKQQSHHF